MDRRARLRLLLDTHAVLWWLQGDEALSTPARDAIADDDAEVFASAASAMEITMKNRIGKLPRAARLARDFEAMIDSQGFASLPSSLRHARVAGLLAIPHNDPFDRLLIAQAQVETLTLVTNEALFDGFGVVRLW